MVQAPAGGGEEPVRPAVMPQPVHPRGGKHPAHRSRAGAATRPTAKPTKVANVRPEKHGRNASTNRNNDFGNCGVNTSLVTTSRIHPHA
jgi:hypothetical protein